MKQTRLWLTTIATLLCSLTASAHDFEVGGIYYNIASSTDLTVEVTYRGNYSDSYSNEYSGAVTIPSTVTYNGETYRVTSIGYSAFWDCSSLTAITIPEGVIEIGMSAFASCSSLSSFTIPESVTEIGVGAFCNCRSLTSIVIPGNVSGLYDHEFSGCTSLSSVTLPEGLRSIGYYTFAGCSSLTSIAIPKGMEWVSEGAFDGCSSLRSVHVGSLEDWCGISFGDSWGANPLYYENVKLYVNGKSLDSTIVIPDGVTRIGDFVFQNCREITSVTIGKDVEEIGVGVFLGCENLTAITVDAGNAVYDSREGCNAVMHKESDAFIAGCATSTVPDGTTMIYPGAFAGSSVTSVDLPSSVTIIHSAAFLYCRQLENITIPDGLVYIGESAFEECSSLKAITIPEGVEELLCYTFYGCTNLETLTIGSNVDCYDDSSVFEGCNNIKDLTVMGSLFPHITTDKLTTIRLFSPVPLETEEFSNKTYRVCTVYVPNGSLARYQATDIWKNFWNIKEFDPTGIASVTINDSDAPVYNIRGERMTLPAGSLPQGVYIRNGKKVIIK